MADFETVRVNITLPAGLLKQLDEAAKGEYASRSDAVRMAVLDWIRSDPRRVKLAEGKLAGKTTKDKSSSAVDRLNDKQRTALDRFKKDEIAFHELTAAGIEGEIYLALLKEGEL